MDFLEFGIKDALDILLVALLLLALYRMMKTSGSLNVFIGVIVFTALWIAITHIVQMRLLGTILDKIMNIGAIALVVLFQREIRQFFSQLGAHRGFSKLLALFQKSNRNKTTNAIALPITRACINMSKARVGALIVIENQDVLLEQEHTGEQIDALVSQRLIENIFFKNSPLHDGALLIRGNRIKSAACILPISHDTSIPQRLGLRHRAALGIAQLYDAMAIVVSEETGEISVAHRGHLEQRLNAELLESQLNALSLRRD